MRLAVAAVSGAAGSVAAGSVAAGAVAAWPLLQSVRLSRSTAVVGAAE